MSLSFRQILPVALLLSLVGTGRTAGGPTIVLLLMVLGLHCSAAGEREAGSEAEAADALRALGGHVFLDLASARVSEVNLNGNRAVEDAHLGLVARFSGLTDLSLEGTAVGDEGIAKLVGLEKLEWLNLYQTGITDSALRSLARMESLAHLPIGETKVTDAGLHHLAALTRLEYLGLRGNRVTDMGVAEVSKIGSLTGLNLRQTAVTDATLDSIVRLSKLEELWLSDTAITDAGLKKLGEMRSLKWLHLQRTPTTAGAVRALRKALPDCEIFWESDPR